MPDEIVIEHPINIETAESLEALGKKILEVVVGLQRKRCRVISISHAIDPSAPAEKRYTALIVGESRSADRLLG